jgi:hypothetical protein
MLSTAILFLWLHPIASSIRKAIMDTEMAVVESTAFRPAKRRKFTRNRRGAESDDLQASRLDTDSPDTDSEEPIAPLADIVRLRKTKMRRNGIEFSNMGTRSSEPPPASSADQAVVDSEKERLKAITDRFVAHSGQVVDVDRHMFVLLSIVMS